MRIAFINPVRELGGGERWLLGITAALREQGHSPVILCRPGAEWAGLAIEQGTETLLVPMINDLSLSSVRRLGRALRGANPDIVVCCNQRAIRLGVPASWLAGRPPVIYRNGLAGSFKNNTYNRVLAAGGISGFVVNARALADELTSFGWVAQDRVSVIYNGVDTALYLMKDGGDARQRWGVPDSSTVVLAAGRLVVDKGHIDLVRAARRLCADESDLRVVILGEGPERPRLEAEIRKRGLEGIVLLPGFEGDMPEALAACDVFCHPSQREGLPNAILEAMAARLPVVATNIDGTPEVIVEGVTGCMVNPDDPKALADSLRYLLRHPERRSEMGRRGWIRVQESFSLSHCRREWERLLISARRCGWRSTAWARPAEVQSTSEAPAPA